MMTLLEQELWTLRHSLRERQPRLVCSLAATQLQAQRLHIMSYKRHDLRRTGKMLARPSRRCEIDTRDQAESLCPAMTSPFSGVLEFNRTRCVIEPKIGRS